MLSVDVFTERSINGYPLDVLVSCLQKSIRRGDWETAVQVAVELMYTSRELEDYVWQRLLVISAEDIGSANWYANTVVWNLRSSSRLIDDEMIGDRRILIVQAIRFLCSQEKDRSSCLISDIAKREFGKREIEFGDYVYDMHTTEGLKRGRGFDFFLDTASKVVPDVNEKEESALKERLRELLTDEER